MRLPDGNIDHGIIPGNFERPEVLLGSDMVKRKANLMAHRALTSS